MINGQGSRRGTGKAPERAKTRPHGRADAAIHGLLGRHSVNCMHNVTSRQERKESGHGEHADHHHASRP